MRSAVHDLSASTFLFSLGVAKTFGLRGGGGGGGVGIRAMMKVSRFMISKCWQVCKPH